MNMAAFIGTPSVTVFNNRNQVIRDIAFHRLPGTQSAAEARITRHRFDARGAQARSADPRLHAAGLTNVERRTDLAGTVLRTVSVDAGTHLMLSDILGRACRTYSNIRTAGDDTHDLNQVVCRILQYEHAALPGRLLSIIEQTPAGVARIAERFVYASNTVAEKASNLAGFCTRHYDTAGQVHVSGIALSGVQSVVTRRLLRDMDSVSDWQGDGEAIWDTRLVDDQEGYTSETLADSTGLVVNATDAKGNQQRVVYDVSGRIFQRWLTPTGVAELPIVTALTYSASGQKQREEHGNGVVTAFSYEAQTQRLVAVRTERPAGRALESKVLQALRYEYDPVGNVIKVCDEASETRFWRNQAVSPDITYTHDSLYQLVCATGREQADIGRQSRQLPGAKVPLPASSSAYTCYTRTYTYDDAGNLVQIDHRAPASQNNYTVKTTVSQSTNRGVPSELTNDPSAVDAYFTFGGQQLQLQPGQHLDWTSRNELSKVTPVTRDGQPDDIEVYCYDGRSRRVTKLSRQKTSGALRTRRVLYLPNLELRSFDIDETNAECLHVVTVGGAGRVQVRLVREAQGGLGEHRLIYSYDTAAGSHGLEVDGNGSVVSQEEYYPYGGTAIWTARSQVEADRKTRRYAGKERDATGLYYYGYRYYQPWVGRWLSADPAGTADGLNLFRMCRNNPSTYTDADGLLPTPFPVESLTSGPVLTAVQEGNFVEALSRAKQADSPDVAVIMQWMKAVMPGFSLENQQRIQNRPNNAIYKTNSGPGEFDLVVKRVHEHTTAKREELAFRVSEKLDFHLIPPTYARRGNFMIQTWLTGFRPESSLPNPKPQISNKAAVLYYLINQKDNNAGNRMWDGYNNVMLIDNESGFDERPSPVYEEALAGIRMDTVFDDSQWHAFSNIDSAQWDALLGERGNPLSIAEKKAFIGRVKNLKAITQKQIDRGEIGIGTRRSTLQRIFRF